MKVCSDWFPGTIPVPVNAIVGVIEEVSKLKGTEAVIEVPVISPTRSGNKLGLFAASNAKEMISFSLERVTPPETHVITRSAGNRQKSVGEDFGIIHIPRLGDDKLFEIWRSRNAHGRPFLIAAAPKRNQSAMESSWATFWFSRNRPVTVIGRRSRCASSFVTGKSSTK